MDISLPRPSRSGNLSETERWISMLTGAGLALATLGRGSTLARVLSGAAAVSLISRGTSGYCAVKSALQGEASLTQGMREQWQRVSSTLSEMGSHTALEIDDMHQLYCIELQELHSAESQLATLIESLGPEIHNEALAVRLDEYAAELRARKLDLDELLNGYHLDAHEHPDDAMRALIRETGKMARSCSSGVRDAALAASLQRIIHYKIASYGTIAAYAKALNRFDEAGRFADCVDRDKAVDTEITELAKGSLNPQASGLQSGGENIVTPQEQGSGMRPH